MNVKPIGKWYGSDDSTELKPFSQNWTDSKKVTRTNKQLWTTIEGLYNIPQYQHSEVLFNTKLTPTVYWGTKWPPHPRKRFTTPCQPEKISYMHPIMIIFLSIFVHPSLPLILLPRLPFNPAIAITGFLPSLPLSQHPIVTIRIVFIIISIM